MQSVISNLDSHGNGLYTYDHPPLKRGPKIGGRTSVVRLPGEKVALYSPGPLTPELQAEITRAGQVAALVAPNSMHHIHLAANVSAFDSAKVFVSPRLPARFPNLRYDELLTADAPELWKAEIEQITFEGAPFIGETVWFHKASRSLILCDIAFNVQTSDSLATRVMMKLNDAYGKFGPSRIARLMIRDKAAARRSVERILQWDFDRIVVTHGEIVETGGNAAFRQAFHYLFA